MRYYLGFLFLFLVACTSKTATPNDNDGCVGRCGMVNGVACGHCDYGYSCNAAQYCVEIPGNDVDYWTEEPDEDTVDIDLLDRDLVLTEHEYPEMLKNPYANYPDEDRLIGYTYYGDMDIVVADPENVRALWNSLDFDPQNIECIPAPFDACADHYPHEAQIIQNSAGTTNGYCLSAKSSFVARHQCDYTLTPGCWHTPQLGDRLEMAKNGENVALAISSDMTDPAWQSEGAFLYNFDARSVTRVGRAYFEVALTERYLLMDTFVTIDSSENLVYYDLDANQYGFAYKGRPLHGMSDLRASTQYVFSLFSFSPDDSGDDSGIFYTKIGEWDKWKALTYKNDSLKGLHRRPYFPTMLDNLVAYVDYNYDITLCDLDRGDAGCQSIRRNDKLAGHTPMFRNKGLLYYMETQDIDAQNYAVNMVEANLTDLNNVSYRTIDTFMNMPVNILDGDDKYLLYGKAPVYDPQSFENSTSHICYYRFADQKTFCMGESWDEKVFKLRGLFLAHDLIFETIWSSSKELVVRDMECYCDNYPEQCPFDDYLPKKSRTGAIR